MLLSMQNTRIHPAKAHTAYAGVGSCSVPYQFRYKGVAHVIGAKYNNDVPNTN